MTNDRIQWKPTDEGFQAKWRGLTLTIDGDGTFGVSLSATRYSKDPKKCVHACGYYGSIAQAKRDARRFATLATQPVRVRK